MPSEETQRIKEHIERWRRVGPLLEQQRDQDVRHADRPGAFSFFAGMPTRNLADLPAEPTSGLVEHQRWFLHIARRPWTSLWPWRHESRACWRARA